MTATSKLACTAGRLAKSSSHRRTPPTGPLPSVVRERAVDGGLDPFQDPDGEAGRGRLGHAY